MARIEREVKTILVDHKCDECGGWMRHSGTKMSNPPQYVHSCQRARVGRCTNEEELVLGYKLPHTKHVPVD